MVRFNADLRIAIESPKAKLFSRCADLQQACVRWDFVYTAVESTGDWYDRGLFLYSGSVYRGMATLLEVIAHRGASDEAPENSLAAIRRAWKHQAAGVEVDVQLTGDGQLAVIHDSDTQRTTGRRMVVAESTLAALQSLTISARPRGGLIRTAQRIPSLAQVLAVTPADRRALIEVKSGPEAAPALVEALRQSPRGEVDGRPDRTIVCGFSLDTMEAIRDEAKARGFDRFTLGWIAGFEAVNRTHEPAGVASLLNQARDVGVQWLSLDVTGGVRKPLVDQARAAGMLTYVWTVNDPDQAESLVVAGVDGVITDRPRFMREWLLQHEADGAGGSKRELSFDG